MSRPRIDVVRLDNNWTGLYVDGERVMEAHEIRAEDALCALLATGHIEHIVETHWCTREQEERVAKRGGLPRRLEHL